MTRTVLELFNTIVVNSNQVANEAPLIPFFVALSQKYRSEVLIDNIFALFLDKIKAENIENTKNTKAAKETIRAPALRELKVVLAWRAGHK